MSFMTLARLHCHGLEPTVIAIKASYPCPQMKLGLEKIPKRIPVVLKARKRANFAIDMVGNLPEKPKQPKRIHTIIIRLNF